MAYRPLRIVDLPRGLQPREQLKVVGATNVADDVLIAIILRIGDPEPSEEDIELTRRLIEAGKLLNIPVYDHVVVGRPTEEHLGFFSIAASGLVKFD